MLFLWIFGNNVEDSMGRVRFLVWYLLAGLAATATQTVVTLATTDAAGASIPNIGASGAIAGVLGAYLLLLPQASVLTAFIIGLIFLREIPAVWFIGVWFLLQLAEGGFSLTQPQAGGGTAFFAHVGGFVFGLTTVRLRHRSDRRYGRPGELRRAHRDRDRRRRGRPRRARALPARPARLRNAGGG